MRFGRRTVARLRRLPVVTWGLLVVLAAFGCGARIDDLEPEKSPLGPLDQNAELGNVFTSFGSGKMVRLRHVFSISNPFDEPIRLKKIHSSCGCTSPKIRTPRIAPGESGEVEVTVEAPAIGDAVRENVELATGIAAQPSFTLSLAAMIVPRLEVTQFAPGPIPVRRGESATISFRVTGRQPDDEPASRLVMQGPSPTELVEAELKDEGEHVVDGVRFVASNVSVQVSWPAEVSGQPVAVREAALKFRFGDVRLLQTIRWIRSRSVTPAPKSIFFGSGSASQSRLVCLKGTKAFSVTRIDSNSDEIWARCDSTGPSLVHLVSVGRRGAESSATEKPSARSPASSS